MIRLFILLAITAGAIFLVRWFLTTPAETIAAKIRKTFWLVLGLGLIFLAITGRLNIIFAFLGSAIPVIARYLPNALRLLGLAQNVRSSQAHTPPSSVTTKSMSQQEAFDILGLKSDASRQQIIAAHKRLMQKFHPDKGGSAHLAAQLNLAKDILLETYDN